MIVKLRKLKPKVSSFLKMNSWVGGESRTWASEGALVGAVWGLFLGVFLFLFIWNFAHPGWSPFFEDFQNEKLDTRFFFISFLGIFLMACTMAGAFVGIGLPRFNPSPEQGHWQKNKKEASLPILKYRAPKDIDAERHPEEQIF